MKNKNKLISIIITYYKKKSYIKDTFKSILNQKYKNYEIIFIYDDENKGDLSYIEKLLSKFKKKKIIINKKNFGVAKSRNIAVKFCKGEYIAFLDSDDIWQRNKLYDQINFMKKNRAQFSFTSYNMIDSNNKIIGTRKALQDANYSNLYKSNFIGLSTVMINKKMFSEIRFPNLKTQEDFALWLNLLRKGFKLTHFNKNLSAWRRTENSLSSGVFQKLKDAFKLYYNLENKNFIFAIYSVMILSYNKFIKKIK